MLASRTRHRRQQEGQLAASDMIEIGDQPTGGRVSIRVETEKPVAMKLRLRIPSWCPSAAEIRVNGRKEADGTPGTYVSLDRTWKDGDAVALVLHRAQGDDPGQLLVDPGIDGEARQALAPHQGAEL